MSMSLQRVQSRQGYIVRLSKTKNPNPNKTNIKVYIFSLQLTFGRQYIKIIQPFCFSYFHLLILGSPIGLAHGKCYGSISPSPCTLITWKFSVRNNCPSISNYLNIYFYYCLLAKFYYLFHSPLVHHCSNSRLLLSSRLSPGSFRNPHPTPPHPYFLAGNTADGRSAH